MIPSQRTESKDISSRRIRVLVIDRHPVIGDAFNAWLKHTPDIIYCGQACTAAEAFDHLTVAKPDVVIVSLSLEDAYGLDLAAQFLAMHPQLRILVYSQYDERVFSERAIEAGAMGYIMKNASTDHVIEGIRSVMRNETFLSTPMTARLLNKITKGASAVRTQIFDQLTHRELAVLLMMSEGARPQEMADRLKLDRKTVETHRRRVKEKLGFDSISALLHYATQWRHAHGTLLPVPSADSESGYEQNPSASIESLSKISG